MDKPINTIDSTLLTMVNALKHISAPRHNEASVREVNDALAMLDNVVLPADASRALEVIDEVIAKYGSSDILTNARTRAEAIAMGGVATPIALEAVSFADPAFPASLEELVELPVNDNGVYGNGTAKLLVDRDGKKWVLTGGDDSDDSYAELEAACSMAYRAMGVRAPGARRYGSFCLAEYIDGDPYGASVKDATPQKRKQWQDELQAGFPVDIVLANWHIVDSPATSIVIGEDGHLWRVACGAFGNPSNGNVDASFTQGWIDNLWTMRGKSPAVLTDEDNTIRTRTNGDGDGSGITGFLSSLSTSEILSAVGNLKLSVLGPIFASGDASTSANLIEAIRHIGNGDTRGTRKGDIIAGRITEFTALAVLNKSLVGAAHYMPDYADVVLKMCYALSKANYRELAAAKPKGLEFVYDPASNGTGFVQQKVMGEFKSIHCGKPVAVSGSLESIMTDVANRGGVDLSKSDSMLSYLDPSVTPLDGATARVAVHELHAMGYSLTSIAEGNVNIPDDTKFAVQLCAKSYLAVDRRIFLADEKALMMRKAATMLFFHYSGLSSYHGDTQRLLCAKVVGANKLTDKMRVKEGIVVDDFPMSAQELFAWSRTAGGITEGNGDGYLIVADIPLARISACDLFSHPSQKGTGMGETRISANAIGLPVASLGSVSRSMDITELFALAAQAELASGKTLRGEAFPDKGAYAKVSAPWAKEIAKAAKAESAGANHISDPALARIAQVLMAMCGSKAVPTGDGKAMDLFSQITS